MTQGEKNPQPVDLVEHFASKVPTGIISKLLGVPENEVEQLAKDE